MTVDQERLQRYFDGDLTGLERDQVERELSHSGEASDALLRMSRLRTMVRGAADASSEHIDSDALFARITQGIAAEGDEPKGRVTRCSVDASRRRRRAITAGLSVALAAAAAVALAIKLAPESAPMGPASDVAGARSAMVVTQEPPHGSEVVDVDFGSNTGTVFEVQGDGGAPVAVVWINDEEPGSSTFR